MLKINKCGIDLGKFILKLYGFIECYIIWMSVDLMLNGCIDVDGMIMYDGFVNSLCLLYSIFSMCDLFFLIWYVYIV